MKQALLVIDMQNGFLDPVSPLCIRGARATVPAIGRVVAGCRRAGIPVIFVNRSYRADGSNVERTRFDTWAAGGRPLTPESTGPLSAENPPELGRRPDDYEIVKPRWSAFFQTSLDMLLRRLGVDTVVLTGTTTPNCIRTTCYDAISLDYHVILLADCCSSNTMEIQRSNLRDMLNVGAEAWSSEQFLHSCEVHLTVRPAVPEDLDRCDEIESAAFPPEQAASREDIRRRIGAYSGHVLVGELDGRIVGHIMGPVIRQATISDDMFADTACHDPDSHFQAVFSLAVHPDYRRRGFGRDLMDALLVQARREGRRGVTLTCRDERVGYYESFGFTDQGLSASVHGGVPWHDMLLFF